MKILWLSDSQELSLYFPSEQLFSILWLSGPEDCKEHTYHK